LVRSSIGDALQELEPHRTEIVELERDYLELIQKYDTRARKKNYSQRLSNLLAQKIADHLRPVFPGILPDAQGKKRESLAGGHAGPLRVDVRLHTDYGMGLGISIKTINFRDRTTGRYTKNLQRNDKELRSEASSLHAFQPQAVLIGLVLLPEDSRHDAKSGYSSFEHAMNTFRLRSGRRGPDDQHDRFERLFVGTYASDPDRYGALSLHDVGAHSSGADFPPVLGWKEFLEAVCDEYERRTRTKLRRRQLL
jgi:hypothetical protein